MNRRQNLALLLGAAAWAGMPGCAVQPGSGILAGTGAIAGAIDVHAHFVPDFYRKAAEAAGHAQPDGMPGFPEWSPDLMLEVMDRGQIARSILSISSPGVHFGDEAVTRELVRDVNNEAARLSVDHPGRFGFFASLPLPDISATVAEVERSLGQLGASGVVMHSNHEGAYPGDEALEGLMQALDKFNAVVFLHPTSPNCACGRGAKDPMPAPILEFMFETTRAVMSIIRARIPERFPGIRFIIPHGGAAIPALADRMAVTTRLVPEMRSKTPEDIIRELGQFYYDLAGAPLPRQLPALRTLVDDTRLLYGSDWPFTPEPVCQQNRMSLSQVLSAEEGLLQAVMRNNAYRLSL